MLLAVCAVCFRTYRSPPFFSIRSWSRITRRLYVGEEKKLPQYRVSKTNEVIDCILLRPQILTFKAIITIASTYYLCDKDNIITSIYTCLLENRKQPLIIDLKEDNLRPPTVYPVFYIGCLSTSLGPTDATQHKPTLGCL